MTTPWHIPQLPDRRDSSWFVVRTSLMTESLINVKNKMKSEDKRDAMAKNKNSAIFICIREYVSILLIVLQERKVTYEWHKRISRFVFVSCFLCIAQVSSVSLSLSKKHANKTELMSGWIGTGRLVKTYSGLHL